MPCSGCLPAGLVVATEVESTIRRLEQQLRWAQDKADSLPSSAAWALMAPVDGPRPVISRLLIVRSTRSTRDIARAFEATLAAAYPARAADVHAALTTADAPWPGSRDPLGGRRGAAGRGSSIDRPGRGPWSVSQRSSARRGVSPATIWAWAMPQIAPRRPIAAWQTTQRRETSVRRAIAGEIVVVSKHRPAEPAL